MHTNAIKDLTLNWIFFNKSFVFLAELCKCFCTATQLGKIFTYFCTHHSLLASPVMCRYMCNTSIMYSFMHSREKCPCNFIIASFFFCKQWGCFQKHEKQKLQYETDKIGQITSFPSTELPSKPWHDRHHKIPGSKSKQL